MLPLNLDNAILSLKENKGKLVCLHCNYQSKFNTHLDSMPDHSETSQLIGKFALATFRPHLQAVQFEIQHLALG